MTGAPRTPACAGRRPWHPAASMIRTLAKGMAGPGRRGAGIRAGDPLAVARDGVRNRRLPHVTMHGCLRPDYHPLSRDLAEAIRSGSAKAPPDGAGRVSGSVVPDLGAHELSHATALVAMMATGPGRGGLALVASVPDEGVARFDHPNREAPGPGSRFGVRCLVGVRERYPCSSGGWRTDPARAGFPVGTDPDDVYVGEDEAVLLRDDPIVSYRVARCVAAPPPTYREGHA